MRNIKKIRQLFLLLGLTLSLNQAWAASTDQVKVSQKISGGPGCANNDVGIYPRSDRGLTLFYRDFEVTLPKNKPIAREQCTVQIAYDFSGSRQFAVQSVRLYFTNKVDASEGKILFSVNHVDPVYGSVTLASGVKDVEREGFQSLVIEDKNAELQWSPCQADSTLLQYKAEARLNEGDSVKVRHAFINLVSRPC